jgi:hypothetical protein
VVRHTESGKKGQDHFRKGLRIPLWALDLNILGDQLWFLLRVMMPTVSGGNIANSRMEQTAKQRFCSPLRTRHRGQIC